MLLWYRGLFIVSMKKNCLHPNGLVVTACKLKYFSFLCEYIRDAKYAQNSNFIKIQFKKINNIQLIYFRDKNKQIFFYNLSYMDFLF